MIYIPSLFRPSPRRRWMAAAILVLAIGLVASVAWATPRIDAVHPAILDDGDLLIIEGEGFGTATDRLSVVLRDGQGLVALGEVVHAADDEIQVQVHRMARGSANAEVVVRQGVSVLLVGDDTPAEVETLAATWFHGSGVMAKAGPLVVLPPEGGVGSAGRRTTKPGNGGCDAGVFSIDIPLGCNEITARVTIGGDDPFDMPPILGGGDGDPRAAKAKGQIFDLWQAWWFGRLSGSATQQSGKAAAVLADALSRQLGPFGVRARAETDPNTGTSRVVLEGERITLTSGAVILTLDCVSP